MTFYRAWLVVLGCVALSRAWTIRDRRIYREPEDPSPYHLRGISWFGFETQDFVLDGLWVHPMDYYLDLVQASGFNALRVPFSAEWIRYNIDIYPYDGLVAADPEHQNTRSIFILDSLFTKAAERGIVVMPDLHRLHKEYISELWYSPTDATYTGETFFDTWFAFLDRYGDRPNLLAVDLLNEPHGRATWGSGDGSTDWKRFVETAIPRFEERYPNASWLYVVEGIDWGVTLRGPLDDGPGDARLPAGRVAYSAHQYGKSVVPSVNVWDADGLRRAWHSSWGWMADEGHLVIIGETGGRADTDLPWLETLAAYLKEKAMTYLFFWSLGPNSGDVQGLLKDDWTTIEEEKLRIVRSVDPAAPTA